MSIVVNCECGKQLRAREELAGRKGKCPGCGKMFVIPAPPPPEPAEDELFDLAPEDPPIAKRVAPVASLAPRAPVAARLSSPKSPRPDPVAQQPAFARAPAPLRRAPIVAPKSPVATNDSDESSLPTSSSSRGRELVYLVLLVTFIPLLISTFKQHDTHDFQSRIDKTLDAHPEARAKLADEFTREELCDALPSHKLDDALLARDSWAHWLFALLSAGAFFGAVMLLFKFGTVHPGRLAAIGAFTATAGIFLLLAVQWLAIHTAGTWIRGRGILVLLFYIVKFIGFSYRCALDPDTNFILSFLGFTFGVGMCEELCKSIPILVHYHGPGEKMPWRAACMWGLVSGVGFGVSEGITYSSDFYNGMSGGDIYLVRFISCVALHAIWSGAAAIFIYKHNNLLTEGEGILSILLGAAALVSIPMVLHGLYDTLLKKDHEFWALATAVVSFAWFAFQVETARRTYDEQERPRAPKRGFAVVR